MELLLVSAVPVVGAAAAFVLSVSAALLMFCVEAWVSKRLPSSFPAVSLKCLRKGHA